MKALINSKIREAASHKLADGESFMLFRLPGRAPKLYEPEKGKYRIWVSPWNTLFSESIDFADIKKTAPGFKLPDTTPKDVYIRGLKRLIPILKESGKAKTVISRVIAGCSPQIDWIDAAERLWTDFPDTFGYLFYTPTTGAWLGATPERLVTAHHPLNFNTMALAGTLPVDKTWNVKNYEEHMMVVDFIEGVLREMDLPAVENGPRTLRYGDIKHLSTQFSGLLDEQKSAFRLIETLSPTPALCGFPREDALKEIKAIEHHSRQCYGGYMVVAEGNGSEGMLYNDLYSFVTIRCVQFDPRDGRWAIYSGGGITPKSDPEEEWNETEAKASRLLTILENAR